MPLANLGNSRSVIWFFVWTQIFRFKLKRGVGQCAEDSIHTVGHVLRVIAAFQNEDDLPMAIFIRKLDEFFGDVEKSLRGNSQRCERVIPMCIETSRNDDQIRSEIGDPRQKAAIGCGRRRRTSIIAPLCCTGCA